MKAPATSFGHTVATLDFWRGLVSQALPLAPTPFYLFSVTPVGEALSQLEMHVGGSGLPVRHWLSFKTQPLPPLLAWWRREGGGVEVVSEFEFLAALREGFAPDRILVNGPAKQRWLPRHPTRGLRVNFDSATELDALLPSARDLDWSVGVRCNTREEFDPENPKFPTQFGMEADEAATALRRLKRAGARLETIHFHLRTNVNSPAVYERAIGEVAEICRAARFEPKHLDCGGGLPPPHILTRGGKRYDEQFPLAGLKDVHARAVKHFPGLRELWLENGRFLTARSGVLVVRVLEVKERRNLRQLICDGGRTLNALVSTWEAHEILTLPKRAGRNVLTTVYGPTCMAFDQLGRRPLPGAIQPGDHLLWLEAGAYHLPWETRFSHGLSAVIWHDGQSLDLVRKAESFDQWWGQWQAGPECGPNAQ
jgi:diaminopimelate decarboxylase